MLDTILIRTVENYFVNRSKNRFLKCYILILIITICFGSYPIYWVMQLVIHKKIYENNLANIKKKILIFLAWVGVFRITSKLLDRHYKKAGKHWIIIYMLSRSMFGFKNNWIVYMVILSMLRYNINIILIIFALFKLNCI